MIIDAFTFFNELDLLELRLNYLDSVVDYFVIVESNISHSGEYKSLTYLENKDRFSKFKDKIIYYPYIFNNEDNLDFSKKPDKFDYNSSHWFLEKNQRNHILTAVKGFDDSAYIIISDLDEIPSTAAIKFASENLLDTFKAAVFQQALYYYNPYTLDPSPWCGSVFTTIQMIKQHSPQWFRDNRNDSNKIPRIYNAGWHFSYFGGKEKILKKINNTAHQELNQEKFKVPENIENAVKNGVSLYSDTVYKKVELDLLPPDIVQWMTPFIEQAPISVVVPTMWKYDKFTVFLEKLVDCKIVKEILIIDNDRNARPINQIFENKKIKIFDFNKNIFVNPAWNLGVKESSCENICLMNDDIEFDLRLFEKVSNFLNQEKLLGLCPGIAKFGQPEVTDGKIHFEKYKNQNFFGFGCLMFFQKTNYIPIPDQLNIYYGDNWIVETMLSRFDQTYLITNLNFNTPYASTTKTLPDKEIILHNEHLVYKKEIEKFKKQKSLNPIDILEQEYQNSCNIESDINQHIPILRKLADSCDTMVEMGVRSGVSTRAFLSSKIKKINSYDLTIDENVENLFEFARLAGKDATYTKADVLTLDIDPVDIIFIDTWHTYNQLTMELAMHGNKAKKYLIFHDTHTFGLGPVTGDKGLLPAILEFMAKNPHWHVHYHTTDNNGLTILKRNNFDSSSNLVIGAALGYDLSQIELFVKSFRKVNLQDDLILIVDSTPSDELLEFSKNYNIKFEHFHTNQFLDMWLATSRFIKILEIIESSRYRNVLITDVRDVVFQKNPFDIDVNQLMLFSEDSGVMLGDEEINTHWVKTLFEPEVLNQIKSCNIICGGTILGTQDSILNLLRLMKEYIEKTPLRNKIPIDQVLLNYLCHTKKLSHIPHTLNKSGDIVATVGLTVTHKLAKDVIDIKDNLVYINGQSPAIVHQYDRSTELVNHFNLNI